MSVPAYPSYRDSGVEWLGEVPSHWELKRLAHFFDERREKCSDLEFPALSVTKNGVVPQLETAAKTDDGDNRKKVLNGDFVINSRSDRKGSSGLSSLDGSVSLINTVLEPTPQMHGPFAHHLLRSVSFQEEYYRYGKGIVADLWSTNFSEMRNILLAVPSPPEQSSIAAFLDRETAKIDALVEEQRRLGELLKEKRQAVISHAVTKGLDPTVPMKDSGVKWLGEVPAHWMITQVKHVISQATSGPRGWSDLLGDEGDVFFQSQNIGRSMNIQLDDAKRIVPPGDSDAERARLLQDDVVICITGARTGAVAHARSLAVATYINQHVCLMRPKIERCGGRYLAYALHSHSGQEQLSAAMYGLKQGMGLDQVRSQSIAVPPVSEQVEIVQHLDDQAGTTEELVAEAEAAITLLQERRSALISAAVTGKIDVRGLLPTPCHTEAA